MKTFHSHITEILAGIYSSEEIRYFKLRLLEKVTGSNQSKILAQPEYILSANQQEELRVAVERLKKHEPIQYIICETEFCGLKFKVNPSVLIPRPETEELVEWITPLSFGRGVGGEVKFSILDIGTGSGCIAVALKKFLPAAEVSAMDISAEALNTARENAEMNGVHIDFIQADILSLPKLDKQYDIIVSNPPYVPEQDKSDMQKNVLEYEPHTALFVKDNDPLLFYRKIAELGKKSLKPNGKLFFEIHKDQSENCRSLLTALGYKNIQTRQDLSGNDRMVRCEV